MELVTDHPDDTEAAPTTAPGALGTAVGVLGVIVVAAAAALVAHLFREAGLAVLELLWDRGDPTEIARGTRWWLVAGVVAVTLVAAATIGRAAIASRRPHGLGALSAAGRGESDGPAMATTLRRALATFLASIGLVSLGRESAIIETGGGLGAALGRRTAGWGPALAAGGVAAAFAAAYHAPIAAVLYAEEHLRVRHDRRTAIATIAAALIGYGVMTGLLGGHTIFPGTTGSRWGMLALVAVVAVPTVLASRGFLEVRDRVDTNIASGGWMTRRRARLGLVVVAVGVVAALPITAGNGMEALRHASTGAGVGLALALAIGKLAATTATLGTGAPGGVLSPTLAVSAGWALLCVLGLEAVGVPLPGSHWDAMLVAMAVGVAVGLRSPLVAIVLVPEMVGDLTLLPITAVAVGAAVLLDHAIDVRRRSHGEAVPATLHGEDA